MEKSDQSKRLQALSPTKRALLLKALQKERHAQEPIIVSRSLLGEPVPLSFTQESLWLLHQLDPESPAYNVSIAIHFEGALNKIVLEKSINETIRRHAALRTTFALRAEQPVQIVAPSLTLTLPTIDLCAISNSEQKAFVEQLAIQEAHQTFDLVQGPLLRVRLLQLSQTNHILLFLAHHIIYDAVSRDILIKEISSLYKAFVANRASPFTQMPMQYTDFALWQRERLQGDLLDEFITYWKGQLDGRLPVHKLPTYRPRPEIQAFRGAKQSFVFPAFIFESLKIFSRKEKVTLFTTLLAAFSIVLQRYSGQTDIIIGTPIAGRTRSEFEDVVGFFSNSLVIRTDLSGNPTFRDYLKQVKEVLLGAQTYQDFPFEKLVEELRPARSLSYHPVFQIVFAFQNDSIEPIKMPGLTMSMLEIGKATSQFDLTANIVESSEELGGVFEYNTDLFTEAFITQMTEHFQTLVQDAVTNPGKRLAHLTIMTPGQYYQVVQKWNDVQRPYPQDKCVHEQFEEQVSQTPNKTAVVYEDEQLTYQELNDRANQLAHFLRPLIQPTEIVGLCTECSLDMVIGILGILKAGGTYMPLDPANPQERLAYMLSDANVPVLLTHNKLLPVLPEHTAKVFCLDTDWADIHQKSKLNLTNLTSAQEQACVMYTSGSTGAPKGISITHQAINRLVCNTNYIKISPSDRIAQVANAAFDAVFFEMWGALLNGAQLIGINKDVVLSPRLFAAQLLQQDVTVMFVTTALFNQLASQAPDIFSSLRCLLFGGEKVEPKWVKVVANNNPPEQLLHVYGPTESTTFTTWYQVKGVTEERQTIPIGCPVANTQCHLLDANGQLVPIGGQGELYIGGDGLAQGYLNKPALTAERFVPNPFSSQPGHRLYKTGDLARYLPDGNLEFLTRIDNQVKIRGFRIEMGEIEATLTKHKKVYQAVVVCQGTKSERKRLIAYLILKKGTKDGEGIHFHNFLSGKLPDYMIPSAFIILEKFPFTQNGKIDYQALPTPVLKPFRLVNDHVSPQTPLEVTLENIWRDLLLVEQISVHDNFFELGGNSLLAIQLISRIRQNCQIEMPVRELFLQPTIQGIAEAIQAIQWSLESVERPSSKEQIDREIFKI